MAKSQTNKGQSKAPIPPRRTVHGKWVATEIQLANKIPFRTAATTTTTDSQIAKTYKHFVKGLRG